MNWNLKDEYTNWNSEITNIEGKEKVAKKIANLVKDGDVIGFGSGSTSFLAVKEISKKIKTTNIKITAIPTSYEIKLLCNSLGIPTVSLLEKKPDWSFDGADEVDNNNWLIKGRGAAMFKEKLNIINSKKVYILVDNSKFVNKLGEKFKIPVECYPEAVNYVKEALYTMNAIECELRTGKGKDGPIITENNNFILDVKFNDIDSDLEKKIKLIAGVIETGLFIGYPNIEIVKES
ncbi:MAG: ribose 5-phosphate isomerase A [Clostridia bacterium]|nr:ribose 5-phosphate isomerase A [Clostridia bacterium]